MSNSYDWIIHNITDMSAAIKEERPDISFDKIKHIGNVHTHGLDKYNHPELCTVLNIDPYILGRILNSMGKMVQSNITSFSIGRFSSVLQGDYEVELIKFPDENVLYIMLPDKNNKLPGEEGCQEPYCHQRFYAKLIHEHNIVNGMEYTADEYSK